MLLIFLAKVYPDELTRKVCLPESLCPYHSAYLFLYFLTLWSFCSNNQNKLFPIYKPFLDCQSIIKWLTAVIPSFQVLWLRLRLLVLRGLALAVSLVPKPPQNMQAMNNGAAEPVFPLELVITELTEVLQEIEKHPGTREKVSRVMGAKKSSILYKVMRERSWPSENWKSSFRI